MKVLEIIFICCVYFIITFLSICIMKYINTKRQVLVINVFKDTITFECFRRAKNKFLFIDFGCVTNEDTNIFDAITENGEIRNSRHFAEKIDTMIKRTARLHKRLDEQIIKFAPNTPTAVVLHTSEPAVSDTQRLLAEDTVSSLGYKLVDVSAAKYDDFATDETTNDRLVSMFD